MRAITNWLDRFCYKHPRFGIPNLMKYIVFGNIIVYLIDMVSSGTFSYLLSFIPYPPLLFFLLTRPQGTGIS